MARPEIWGWLLFLLSAVGFMVVGVRDADPLLTVSSLLFLIACLVFLRSYFSR